MALYNIVPLFIGLTLMVFDVQGAEDPYSMDSPVSRTTLQLESANYPYDFVDIAATDLDVTCYVDTLRGVSVDVVKLDTTETNEDQCPFRIRVGPTTPDLQDICSSNSLHPGEYNNEARRVFIYFQRNPDFDGDLGVRFQIYLQGLGMEVGCSQEYVTPTTSGATTPTPAGGENGGGGEGDADAKAGSDDGYIFGKLTRTGLIYLVVIIVLVIFIGFIVALIASLKCKKKKKTSTAKGGEPAAHSDIYDRRSQAVATIPPNQPNYYADIYQTPPPMQPAAVVHQNMNDLDHGPIINNGRYSSTVRTGGYSTMNPQDLYAVSIKSQNRNHTRSDYYY